MARNAKESAAGDHLILADTVAGGERVRRGDVVTLNDGDGRTLKALKKAVPKAEKAAFAAHAAELEAEAKAAAKAAAEAKALEKPGAGGGAS